jgi:hypothetical protein
MTKRILFALAFTVQSAWAIVNWVAKTDPAQNDFSNLDNWPAAIATDKAIQFYTLNPAAPELWMSEDATFARLVLGGTNIVFNLGSGRTLSVGQEGETKLNAAKTFVRLTSGTINQTANRLVLGQDKNSSNCVFIADGPTTRYLNPQRGIHIGAASNAVSCGMGVYNGAVVDGNFYIGNHAFSSGNWVEAAGTGTVVLATNNHFYVGDTAASSWNRLSLSESAALQMMGANFCIGNNSGSDSNQAKILSGSSVTGQSETIVGNKGSENTLEAGNATLKMSSLFTIGYYSGSNSVRLTNTFVQSNGIYLGRDPSSSGENTLEVIGGTVTNTGGGIRVGIYGNRNTVVISNAYVCPAGNLSAGEYGSENSLSLYGDGTETRVAGLIFGGNAEAHKNTLRLSGCVITNTGGFGNNGAENRIEIANGSKIWSGGHVGGTAAGVSNVLNLTGGSFFSATTAFNFGNVSSFNTMIVDNSAFIASNVTFCLGYTEGTANSNTLAVINNGYLYAYRLRIGDRGSYNTLIISNSTVHAGSNNCTIPYQNGISTNNQMVFIGTNCLLKSEADICIRSGTTLTFVIPRGGYAEPPIQTLADTAKNINIDPTTRIVLDLTEFARGGGGEQVLARTDNNFSISETTLSLLNAQIAPQQCALEIVGKELILHTPHTGGTVISLW